jgi:transcriptional regulator with XRE-family HTH domain
MDLSEKIALLRSLEGNLRGMGRPLNKSEVSRMILDEHQEKISVPYLSQLESGKRPHMTEKTRELLARFFKVHPGYLVSDPKGYKTELSSVHQRGESCVDDWLREGASLFAGEDSEMAEAIRHLAEHHATRELLILAAEISQRPELISKMRELLSGGKEIKTKSHSVREEMQ